MLRNGGSVICHLERRALSQLCAQIHSDMHVILLLGLLCTTSAALASPPPAEWAVITGASGGIGRALAREAAAK
eukprot:4571546-Prymnesium_polylepis.1